PSRKLVTAEGGSNDAKAFKKNKSLIAQKKGTPNKGDPKVKSCGMLLDDFLTYAHVLFYLHVDKAIKTKIVLYFCSIFRNTPCV
ncbi:hypothetical protein ABTE58_18820, partial [Acinetobacter baumannii]